MHPLTETGRLRLARCVVEDGWPLRRAAVPFRSHPPRQGAGPSATGTWARQAWPTGLPARTTAPAGHRPAPKVRLLRRWGPARVAHLLGLVPSTVHRILVRYRLARLTHLDRATGRVIRRCERDRPGELVHVDI